MSAIALLIYVLGNGKRYNVLRYVCQLNPETKEKTAVSIKRIRKAASCSCSLVRVEAESVAQGATLLRHLVILNGTSVIRNMLTEFHKTSNLLRQYFSGLLSAVNISEGDNPERVVFFLKFKMFYYCCFV